MAQTSQQPQQHPHQCNPCNLIFDSLKSLEVHHTYNHSKNSSEFPFNRSPAYPSYVLGPGSDFPLIPPASSPHSPQPNPPPHQNQSHRYHPYSYSNNYPPESPRNNVSSSSPGVNNQPRTRGFPCDRCNFLADSQQRLLEHLSVAHSKSPTSNFQFNDCFPPPTTKAPGPGEEILDLDSQKVVYNSALGGDPNEENGINGRNHSVNSMVSSWVNNSHDKKYYQMSHQNGNLPSPDFPSVSSTTISPPNSESMQQMQYQPYEPNQQMPSQISSSQTAGNTTNPVPNGKRDKSSGGSWKSNEARRPKTYNCSACNKWFTSSGHLKRHYNTTLHKNAVKQSNQPDPAGLPISIHHHPHKDPTYAAGLQGSAPSPPSSRPTPEEGPASTPAPLHSTKSECESPVNNANNSRNVISPTNYNNYPNFLSNSPNLMAGPSEHQSGGLLLSHPHLPQINSHLGPMSPHLPPSINSHLPPINSHLSSINQYPAHPPQYPPTSNIHLIQSTSPGPAMATPQFMALAASQGIPPSQGITPSQCPASPGAAMAMNYPNLQAPHVSTTQLITTNSNFGNLNSEGIPVYQNLENSNIAYYPVHAFNHYQNVSYNQIVEPDYYNSSQSMENCTEDVGGPMSPLSAENKAQSPQNESYSMETFTKIGNSPNSNGMVTDSRSDSGLETSPSPLDIKKEYAYELGNFEDKNKLFIKSEPGVFTKDVELDRFKVRSDEYLMSGNQTQFSENIADSSVKRKKGAVGVKKRAQTKQSDEKNQVSSTLDSFPGDNSGKVENKVIHRCVECDKIFNRSCYLTQHNKSFHSGVEKPFKCSRCGKRFVAESLHIEHLNKHGGDKPFKCDMCPKQFNHKTDLRRHMCLHSGEKPFSCDVCGKGFIRKDHMLKHTETHRRKHKENTIFTPAPQKVLS